MTTRIALKVDVDTHVGAREGIPRLREIFGSAGVAASFFVTMGPDNSGKAIRRVLTRKGFLGKMLRTRAATTYGWRTALSGTLLPARPVGSGFPDLLKALEADGHEVGPHGWDHVDWHDRLARMGLDETRRAFEEGYRACERALGHPAEGSAAPGWQCTPHSLEVQDSLGLVYHSDTRGTEPFVPRLGQREYRAIEIPTTLPTLDEVIGTPEFEREGAVAFFDRRVREGALEVMTVHTETEGMGHAAFMRDLVRRWRSRGFVFVRLLDVARALLPGRDALPRHGILWGSLAGRAGDVACQAPLASRAEGPR